MYKNGATFEVDTIGVKSAVVSDPESYAKDLMSSFQLIIRQYALYKVNN